MGSVPRDTFITLKIGTSTPKGTINFHNLGVRGVDWFFFCVFDFGSGKGFQFVFAFDFTLVLRVRYFEVCVCARE